MMVIVVRMMRTQKEDKNTESLGENQLLLHLLLTQMSRLVKIFLHIQAANFTIIKLFDMLLL